MSGARFIQNFRGQRGVLSGGPGMAVETLEASLSRLGMTLVRLSDVDPAGLDAQRDILLLDGDCPLAPGLAGPAGSLISRVPAIGLVGVEAPSRLKALMDLGVTAFLRKPVHAAAVYAALFLSVNSYNRLRGMELALADHESRRRGRRAVVKAVVQLMQTTGISDDEAYDAMRRESMRRRISIEDYAGLLTADPSASQSLLERKKWA
jgi:AmiR/NasT family two-component response regulator